MGFVDTFIEKHRVHHLRPKEIPKERACSKCKEVLPLTSEYFYRGASYGGFASACKKCMSENYRKKYRELHPIPEKPESFRCKVCGVEKPFTLEYFPRAPSNRWKISYRCKDCGRIHIKDKVHVPEGKLRCTGCGRIKREDQFSRSSDKIYHKRRAHRCKDCVYYYNKGGSKKAYQQEHFGGKVSFSWLWDYIQSPEFDPNHDGDVTTEAEKEVEIQDWIDGC